MIESVTAWLDANWFSLLIGVFLVGMMLYGHSCGFIHLAVSLSAVVITLFLVHAALPYVTDYISKNTKIEESVQNYILEKNGLDTLTEEQTDSQEDQNQIIAGMQIPDNFRDLLTQNNRSEVWEELGVARFTQYVADYLAKVIINYVGFVVLFAVIWVLLHIFLHVLDIFTRLPVIHGLNQIAGAVLGLAEALIIVWLVFLLIGVFSGTEIGGKLMDLIQQSAWMSALYRTNLVALFLQDLISSLI